MKYIHKRTGVHKIHSKSMIKTLKTNLGVALLNFGTDTNRTGIANDDLQMIHNKEPSITMLGNCGWGWLVY